MIFKAKLFIIIHSERCDYAQLEIPSTQILVLNGGYRIEIAQLGADIRHPEETCVVYHRV